MAHEIVILKDVVKIYVTGKVRTYGLRGLSLRIQEGDYIAIMGPSGSGKSTLLNIMGLLDRPTSGKVLIAGRDASKLSDREAAKLRNQFIGFVFQQFNLINRLTVFENIELPLIPRGIPRSRRRSLVTRALLDAGGELSWLPKKPLELSGGQQQRAAIARAIVGSPKLILADEPTGALDRKSSRIVIETFTKLNKEGHTIVIVTHDPEVANCTNKIYQLRDGTIVGSEEPDRSKCILETIKP
ncbi:ABC transporter ATP-binding protein YknY [Pyrofollis japonicus]|uniref:ABC transporter ATP-binding protein n=1 Tax=Pyrofollis japonicus TaxID=3060460 RepID=UPI00295BFAA5|nr:ABC transporter ATP-binding protein [Pyrofollis japonicus]BEP18238.1 ABC transporter ATP-binding protein YknY [Pyrofollis japonicus]